MLSKGSEQVELFRAQGRLDVLRRLVELKAELRQYGDKQLAMITGGQKVG